MHITYLQPKRFIVLLFCTLATTLYCMDNSKQIILSSNNPDAKISSFAFNPLNNKEGAIGFTNGTIKIVEFEQDKNIKQEKQLFQLPPDTGIPTHLSFCPIPIKNSVSQTTEPVIVIQQKKISNSNNTPSYSTGCCFLPPITQNTVANITPLLITTRDISTPDNPIEEIKNITYTSMNNSLQAFIMSKTNSLHTYTFQSRKMKTQTNQPFHYLYSLNNNYYAGYNNNTKNEIEFRRLQHDKSLWHHTFKLKSSNHIGAYAFGPNEKVFVVEIAAQSTISIPSKLSETTINKRSLCYFCTQDGHYLGSTEIENAEDATIENLSFNVCGNVLGVMLSNNTLLFPDLSSILQELHSYEKINPIMKVSKQSYQNTLDSIKKMSPPPPNPFIEFLELVVMIGKLAYQRRNDILPGMWNHKGKIALLTLFLWYQYR